MSFSYELEKYHGTKSRFACPECGVAGEFKRYVDCATDAPLSDDVGRCNRESKCGYHKTPKDFFRENPNFQSAADDDRRAYRKKNVVRRDVVRRDVDSIPLPFFRRTLTDYANNGFINFLLSRFSRAVVGAAINRYRLGTWNDGRVCFWQIDAVGRVRTGKLMRYDAATGKRSKDDKPDWTHAALKRSKELPETFELSQCFFGEHLLTRAGETSKSIAVVEAAKTAVVANIFFPSFVWLSVEGKTNRLAEKLRAVAPLYALRAVVLFPDSDAFDDWTTQAVIAREQGLNVAVSSLLEDNLTTAEKSEGFDLADYLLADSGGAVFEITGEGAAMTIAPEIDPPIKKTNVFDFGSPATAPEWLPGMSFARAKTRIIAALDAMTDAERQFVFDELSERAAIIQVDSDLNGIVAQQKAEKCVFGALIAERANQSV